MEFPLRRPRRLRRDRFVRDLVRETSLEAHRLVQPLFVEEALTAPAPIASMPGQNRWPVDSIEVPVAAGLAAGVRWFLLFGSPAGKSANGNAAWAADGVVPRALRRLRARCPDARLITDVCLCQYTDHGHCGLLDAVGEIDNDATLPLLVQMAVTHARAGAHLVAPSDMMDGRVGAIRAGLDLEGFDHLPIMAYAAKFASCFYGPFREAAHSAPAFGDRCSYQLDPANGREALQEIALDWAEGADLVMVKPAMPYLDIIARARDGFPGPIAAYQVSGEYAMLVGAAAAGAFARQRAILESLTAIRRAGADIIITYFATEIAPVLGAATRAVGAGTDGAGGGPAAVSSSIRATADDDSDDDDDAAPDGAGGR